MAPASTLAPVPIPLLNPGSMLAPADAKAPGEAGADTPAAEPDNKPAQ
jgi:hypothetical protein